MEDYLVSQISTLIFVIVAAIMTIVAYRLLRFLFIRHANTQLRQLILYEDYYTDHFKEVPLDEIEQFIQYRKHILNNTAATIRELTPNGEYLDMADDRDG